MKNLGKNLKLLIKLKVKENSSMKGKSKILAHKFRTD